MSGGCPPPYTALGNDEDTEGGTHGGPLPDKQTLLAMNATHQPLQQVSIMSQPYQPPMMPYPMYTVGPPKLPWEFVPHDFLLPTILIMIFLTILNITTLVFTIPALLCSVLAFEKRRHGMHSYKGAKNLGIAALVLDIVALMYYFSTTFIGVTIGSLLLRILQGGLRAG